MRVDALPARWRVIQGAAVHVHAYPTALDLCDREQVSSAYEGKFSLQHCVAAALTDGKVVFDSFEPEARTRLADMRSRIPVSTVDEFAAAYPVHWGSRVTLRLEDGSTVEQTVRDARGDPELPFTHDHMVAKAVSLLRHGGHGDPDGLLVKAVLAMADDGPVPDIAGMLSP